MVFVGTSGRCCGARLLLRPVIPTLAKPVPPRISVRTEHADSEAPPGVVWPRQVDTDDAASVAAATRPQSGLGRIDDAIRDAKRFIQPSRRHGLRNWQAVDDHGMKADSRVEHLPRNLHERDWTFVLSGDRAQAENRLEQVFAIDVVKAVVE